MKNRGIVIENKSPVQKKSLIFEAKIPYYFDRNKKRSAQTKKEQRNSAN